MPQEFCTFERRGNPQGEDADCQSGGTLLGLGIVSPPLRPPPRKFQLAEGYSRSSVVY